MPNAIIHLGSRTITVLVRLGQEKQEVEAHMMKSVVKSVVTLKSGLSIRYHCETLINWGKRVDFLPLYITNNRNCEYSQILTPIFLVTTKMTTVLANFILGGHFHERYQLYPDESCTSARGVTVRQIFCLARNIPSAEGTILNLET